MTELEDDEDGVLEEEEDNEENDQDVSVQYFVIYYIFGICLIKII